MNCRVHVGMFAARYVWKNVRLRAHLSKRVCAWYMCACVGPFVLLLV